MLRRVGSILFAVLVAAWLVLRPEAETPSSGRDSSPTAAPTTSSVPSATSTPSRRPSPTSARGFRTPARLEEHYEKHGAEFGRVTIEDYLVMAQALRDAPVGGDVLEAVRPSDGVISRFDRATGAFLAVDADGTIRTFFKPNDGEAYFRRQANRRPSS